MRSTSIKKILLSSPWVYPMSRLVIGLLFIWAGGAKLTQPEVFARSHNAAMWAVKLGYTDVYRYPGGIKPRMEADHPVEKSQ
jgi:hypothetical protein